MELQALYIKAFGGLKDYSLRFQAGAMLFYGPNERGKTTVLTFIRAMFYGLGERRGLDSLRERFTPRDGTAMSGNIWFEHEGTNYELSRTFGVRKGLDQVTLTDLERNRYVELEDAEQPGRELFGLTQEVFANSVFVEPTGPKLSGTVDTRRELWETLSDFMVSSDDKVSTAQVQERLRRARLALRSAGGKKGEIPVLASHVVELDREVQDLEARQDEEARLTQQLDVLHERLTILRRREAELEEDIMVFEYLEDRERLHLATEPAERRRELGAAALAIEERLQGLGSSDSIRQRRLEQLKSVTFSLEEAEKSAVARRRESQRLTKHMTTILQVIGAILLILGVGLFVWTYLNAANGLSAPIVVASLVMAIPGLALLVFGRQLAERVTGRANSETQEQQETQTRRLQELRQLLPGLGFDRTADKLAKAAPTTYSPATAHSPAATYSPEATSTDVSAIDQTAADVPTNDQTENSATNLMINPSDNPTMRELQQIREFLAHLEDEQHELTHLHEQIDQLGERSRRAQEALGDPEAFRRRLDETRASLAQTGRNLEQEKLDYTQADLTAVELRDVRTEIQEYDRQETETRVNLQALLREPGTTEPVSPAAKLAEVSRELEENRAKLKQLQLRQEALELAENTLAGNLLELREKLLPRLAQNAGLYMKQLSRGNYDSILVNENLEIMLRDSQSGHYYTPENFSTGTGDQLWFSFRLALTDYLGSGTGLPLLLDDLFMNFDDKRAAEGLDLLSAKAQDGQQVLLLTCHKRILKLAEEKPDWSCRTMPES